MSEVAESVLEGVELVRRHRVVRDGARAEGDAERRLCLRPRGRPRLRSTQAPYAGPRGRAPLEAMCPVWSVTGGAEVLGVTRPVLVGRHNVAAGPTRPAPSPRGKCPPASNTREERKRTPATGTNRELLNLHVQQSQEEAFWGAQQTCGKSLGLRKVVW